jgi:hypothetical protein
MEYLSFGFEIFVFDGFVLSVGVGGAIFCCTDTFELEALWIERRCTDIIHWTESLIGRLIKWRMREISRAQSVESCMHKVRFRIAWKPLRRRIYFPYSLSFRRSY